MAFQKEKTDKGFSGDYWRIVQLNCNFDRSDAVVTLAQYKDEATRDADATAVMQSVTFDLAEELLGATYGNGADNMKSVSLKEAYKAIKKMATTEQAKIDNEDDDTGREDIAFFETATDV